MSEQQAGYERHPTDLYPEVLDALHASKAGDQTVAPVLIRYLERDVYSLGSGYLKANVAKALSRLSHDDRARARLEAVIVVAIKGRARAREYQAYTKLARSIDSPGLRSKLERLAVDGDDDVAMHARWFLERMPPPR